MGVTIEAMDIEHLTEAIALSQKADIDSEDHDKPSRRAGQPNGLPLIIWHGQPPYLQNERRLIE